jgi:hypothetical protein
VILNTEEFSIPPNVFGDEDLSQASKQAAGQPNVQQILKLLFRNTLKKKAS